MAEFEERPRLSIGPEETPPYPLEKLTGRVRRITQMPALHQGRIPPQAVEVEQAVLGAMLIEPSAIPRAIEILSPEAFYDPRHDRIYRAIIRLFEQGCPVDAITVTEELRRFDELEQAGGPIYLGELTSKVASAANVEYHARIIAEKALLRRMIETMSLLIGRAYEPGADAFELLDQVEAEIFRLSDGQLRKPARSMSEVVKETIERLEAVHGRPGGITGVPSGFHELDRLTGGWQRSDLIVIAARPSMGKTAFALSCARNAALHPHYGTGVAIFSLEMGAEQLAQRLLTAEARVDAQAARTGRLRDEDWRRLARAAGRLSDAPIFIDDTPALNVLELRAKSRRLKAEHDIGLIIVDYLQLMRPTRLSRNANREQEIAQISRALKALAKELNVPVIALSQLSRAVETRGGDKRPQLSDLRESGAIEQDADVVIFIYRPERYGITTDDRGNPTDGIAEIIIGKQRNGPIDTVRLAFIDQYARFENLTIHYHQAATAIDAPTEVLNNSFLAEEGEAPF
jgi:replicative DNA helicase